MTDATHDIGAWVWSRARGQAGRVLDRQRLWNETLYEVWFPEAARVERLGQGELQPLAAARALSADEILYRAAAARVAEALGRDVLLAPIEAPVIPLPHQIHVLGRVMAGDRVRFLLADEVGLGKTIEAGLVMRELKLRGLAQRVLVVAPKGLVVQWVSEMRVHFQETFHIVAPSAGLPLSPEQNLWRRFDHVVCAMDAVKPIERRRGWSADQVAEANRRRFDDLVAAGWDLVIVDEAHRLGGSSEGVARYQLGEGLRDAAPYLLLLSATPHQGKPDAFRRLMSLLDAEAFPDEESLRRERVMPYVVRTEKRQAIDADGRPLFKPRRTKLQAVAWDAARPAQRQLYEAVSDYVRDGYNQALSERNAAVGFLLLLMQRLVTSSSRAIHAALARRLDVLGRPEAAAAPELPAGLEEWAELDGQEQADLLAHDWQRALADEQAQVARLVALAAQAEAAGPDAKAQALLEWIYRLQRETGEPDLKLLIFTEFVATQTMLRDFLAARGFAVATLNGAMDLEQRQAAQDAFAGPARCLVSTDAGGEGLNLQFAHVVVNYDIPWNPMRLEQRIGRVDRIGQTRPVQAINFVLADTVEARVQEVLETKLRVILEQFGVDKTGDVLDSAEAGRLFDELYRQAILRPEELDERVAWTLEQVRERALAGRRQAGLLGDPPPLDAAAAQAVMEHPLPRWVERMTVAYVRARGGAAVARLDGWELRWPGEAQAAAVTFAARLADAQTRHLTLAEPRVRELAGRLPLFVAGEPLPQLVMPALPAAVRGVWSLWQIAIRGAAWQQQRVLPLFQSADGRVYQPTAQRVWEQLLSAPAQIVGYADGAAAGPAAQAAWAAVEQHGRALYDDMRRDYQRQLAREREKRAFADAARRQAIARIGLPSVRQHRLAQLEREAEAARRDLDERATVLPEVNLLLLLAVNGGVE